MKKFILSLVILSFLISCQNNRSKKQEPTIRNQIKTELPKNIKNETIFLDLLFGMGVEEVYNYFNDLVSQGKLELVPHKYEQLSDNGKIYIYKFDFSDQYPSLQNVQATFKTYYIQDKLYKLRINVESEKDTSTQKLKSKLKELYILNYGENYVKRENNYNNSEEYMWIDSSRMIEISEGLNTNILIIYTDLIALKENNETPKEILMREF